ncbi:hypothetical protein A2907_01560 [Candidatus Azambacteria bacterium RIFCSPLOWO2_01_FULL_37_9]|uniref:Uncharacterized protein n=1 Tax=Candidatus Azambacteria bacterium RIFCSPLOWO2_01_FULL_37_9 TaxID=1797297 RepID=A0A1F5C7X5_9BACT|nr:MAG: hypothetical protein A2907_01560 [Candidatus Azambacteria bacterium RIFCSPLOWO2_01_FULL_37_9]
MENHKDKKKEIPAFMETNSVQSLEAQPKTQLHEEIAELEKNLEEKKRLAGISGVEIPYEKEVFKDVIKEHISQKREQILSSLPPSQAQAQQAQVADDAQKLKELTEQKQLEELIGIAHKKSPIAAAHIAEHMKNPRLLDSFHDYLTDQLYDYLVKTRKLREL